MRVLLQSHDYSRWDMPVFKVKGLLAFLEMQSFGDGIYAIELAPGHVFDLMLKRGKTNHALVVFSAAVNRKEIPNPPALYGQALASSVGATLISVSDIALTYDPKLEIGWNAGSTKVQMQKILPRILTHLREALAIEKMVLFGGSAGGFGALYCANIMRDVLPVAANPQTRISEYYAQFVAAYAKACWGWDGTEDIDKFLDGRIAQNLAPLYAHKPKPFLYLQNLNDAHTKRHALPFMKALDGPETPVSGPVGSGYVEFRPWGEGHVAPPRDEIAAVIKDVFAWQGTWQAYIKHKATKKAA